ncbi:MAG: N-6 DNA methylase [Nannocystis sp.]|uniref:HsdM family class I SAM-dependent methyltransferase n=1 Tax=Nannocystis sp. TaxID=1962667 RepID=UPI0024208524|nr:N-6 DNA methylase [Nannocystis sp.]MBK9751928.1 N-6 DNA methylase [Nannocystis sp.]
MATDSLDLRAQLRPYGARSADIVLLDGSATPVEQLRYLDLTRGRHAELAWPNAVVEAAGQPVLHVVDASQARPDGPPLARLCRVLALRAGADHLALLEPGRITIYPLALSAERPNPWTIERDDPAAPGLIPAIAAPSDPYPGLPSRPVSAATAVHDLLIGLLTRTTETLTNYGIAHLDALSLVGRALFIRFLADRQILGDRDAVTIGPVETCLDSSASATRTSRWLDDTFNGDFLPLPRKGSRAWFRGLDDRVFHELGQVLRRSPTGDPPQLGWSDLLFDHIPVSLLSQVYEHHAHHFDPDGARRTSVLYTPRHIAAYMIDEVFAALDGSAAHARILDPAAGGGVFLVEAFRRIAAARWQTDGAPPDTTKLRSILHNQLCGLDISEPALRLCSFGLYLTALELDPGPQPLSRRFDQPLLGSVLHNVRSTDARHPYIGSLGTTVGSQHRHAYDIVIGNPPWSTWSATREVPTAAVDAQVREVEATIRPIVRERLGEAAGQRYTMLDKVPDLPFVWRALDWARPGGRIAFVVHGRFLFKQSEAGQRSRSDLMHAATFTGIVNGAAVRQSQFWPNVAAPFCILFAQNQPAAEDSSFWFVSPTLEDQLHAKARWRIDGDPTRCVQLAELDARPTLLKTLFRGTQLDAQILGRIESLNLDTLVEIWDRHGGKQHHGQGFKVGGTTPTSRPQEPARELWGMRALRERPSAQALDDLKLPRIRRGFACQHPRKRTIYTAPLLLIAETPASDPDELNVYLALEEDIAYNQSFRGFSCAWHAQSELLARYIFLIFGSCLPVYRALLTSGKFGVERDIYEADDLRNFPLRPLESLSTAASAQIVPLSDALLADPARTRASVDAWVCKVYGLSNKDLQVVHDTLAVASPFSAARKRAQQRPTELALTTYLEVLRTTLQPFLGRHELEIAARHARNVPGEPWILLQLDAYARASGPPLLSDRRALLDTLADADPLGASRVTVVTTPGQLLIAVIAQFRYFTASQARLLGLELVHEQAAALLAASQA